MSSVGTLWTHHGQSKGKTIRAAAAWAGLSIKVPASYVHNTDNKKPEFLSKFPHGKIPAFEGADGFLLTEGAAIARYVASFAPNSGLLGGNAKEAALVDQWVHLVEDEVSSQTDLVGQLVKGILVPYAKPLQTTFSERQLRALKVIDAHLATRTFLVGERITLADITVGAQLQRGVQTVIDPATRAQIPNVIRHMETIVNQPKFAGIFDPTEYIDKTPQYVPPPKEKKEKAPPPPKAAPKPKAAAAAEEDDDEPAVPAEPKVHNPLDDLPKSQFSLEDWKRAWSNKDTRGPDGSLEWFYQNFDKEGFSIWRVDFKYNEELTQTYMSSNQITGFINRLEGSRKYAFGSLGVLGQANNSVIAGTLIVRGQQAEPVVNVAPDWESYTYKKLDLAKEEDKAFFEAALAWDLELDGKKWVEGSGKSLK